MQTEMYYFAVFCVWYVTITSHTCVPDRPSLHVTLTKSLIDLSFPGGHFWARKNEEQHGEAGRQFSSRVLVSRIETLQPSGATRQPRDLVAIRFPCWIWRKNKKKDPSFCFIRGESRDRHWERASDCSTSAFCSRHTRPTDWNNAFLLWLSCSVIPGKDRVKGETTRCPAPNSELTTTTDSSIFVTFVRV